jgi:hypothetical protein
MAGGMVREPCTAMGRDGREMGRDCKDPCPVQMVVEDEREIDIGLGF